MIHWLSAHWVELAIFFVLVYIAVCARVTANNSEAIGLILQRDIGRDLGEKLEDLRDIARRQQT
jgi:hypothetical protein